MTTRIYVVITGTEHRLVEAPTAAQAIRHCVKSQYSARVAVTKDLAKLMTEGVTVERASIIDDEASVAKAAANPKQEP